MADLINSKWEITRSNGTVLNLTFLDIGILDSGDFKYTYIKSKDNQGKTFGGIGSDETWKLEGEAITLSFNNGFMVLSGEINSNFDSMEVTFINKQGIKGEWSGKCLDKMQLKSDKHTVRKFENKTNYEITIDTPGSAEYWIVDEEGEENPGNAKINDWHTRHEDQHLEVYCDNHPDALECRVYDD